MDKVKNHKECPPILFLVFNRLDTTREVFQTIRQAKPAKLYVGCDGPRKSKEGESKKVADVRDFILSNVDWGCEVKTLFRDENVGSREAVSGAIDWFFDNEEAGIILEDDCLPHQSFFPYCGELLDRYKSDERIMCISGNNFKPGKFETENSYFFSEMPLTWGWATWRRAWVLFRDAVPLYQATRNRKLKLSANQRASDMWWRRIDKTIRKEVDAWDYLWTFVILANNGLTVIPKNNLVQNIGIGHAQASNTMKVKKIYMLPADEIHFPLTHPLVIRSNYRFEEAMYRYVFNANPVWRRGINKILEILGF